MNLKEVEKAVARIQTALFKNTNSTSIGQLKTSFRGSGLQFKEHQVYSHGDDVRFIDWGMLAKTDEVYTKTFEEERNVEIVIAIDTSLSMLTGYNSISKLQAAIEIAGLLYLLSGETDDTIETLIFGPETKVLPKTKGKKGITLFVSILESMGVLDENGKVRIGCQSEKTVPTDEIEKHLLKYILKKREVIILSDFSQFVSTSFLNNVLRRPNVHCVHISSPLDEAEKLPFSVYGFTNDEKRNVEKDLFRVRSKIQLNDKEKKFGRRFKKVSVEGRYLEDFIKEMA